MWIKKNNKVEKADYADAEIKLRNSVSEQEDKQMLDKKIYDQIKASVKYKKFMDFYNKWSEYIYQIDLSGLLVQSVNIGINGIVILYSATVKVSDTVNFSPTWRYDWENFCAGSGVYSLDGHNNKTIPHREFQIEGNERAFTFEEGRIIRQLILDSISGFHFGHDEYHSNMLFPDKPDAGLNRPY